MQQVRFVYTTVETQELPLAREEFVVTSTGRKTARVLAALEKQGKIKKQKQTKNVYKQVAIHCDSILEMIKKQDIQAYMMLGNGGETVLIGHKQFVMLIGEITPGAYVFDATYHANKNGEHSVLGMKIKVVPWLDGVLVLPNGF